jgi:hypothetical protein
MEADVEKTKKTLESALTTFDEALTKVEKITNG